METINRLFIPTNFSYTANVLGSTVNQVSIESDIHLSTPGINAAFAAKKLIVIYQKRLSSLFHFPTIQSTCSVIRAHGVGAEHLANSSMIWVLVPPFAQTEVSIVAHEIAALWVCEAVELYAHACNKGWESTWSHGEALSRFIGEAFVPGGLNAAGIQSVAAWLNTPGRPDWISKSNPSESDRVPIGCAVAFLHFLHDVLGLPIDKIVATGGGDLEAKYEALTGKKGGYAAMMDVVNKKFPPGVMVPDAIPADSPFLLK